MPSVAPPKYFTYVSQYSTVNPLTYTIQTSQVNFTYAPKPPATQPHIVFTTGNALKPKADTAQANIFKNQSLPQVDVFAGKPNVLQSTPVKLSKSTVKPVGKPTIGKQEQAEFKSEDSSTKANGSSGSSSPALPELAVVDDSVYWNALQDEIDHFNSELQMLSSKVKNLDIQVIVSEILTVFS